MKKEWLTQGEVDDHIRRRVADQLSRDIASYDGSPEFTKDGKFLKQLVKSNEPFARDLALPRSSRRR